MRSAALTLLAWAALCALVHAQRGEVEVLPQAVEMRFPQGYDVYSDAGKFLKTVPGPTSATVQAKTSGKTFAAGDVYLSDWSYERMQKGDRPNWIVPKGSGTTPVSAQVSASNGASTGLVVYPAIKEMTFPEGYSVFNDDGKLIKTVPGPTSVALKGEAGGKTFTSGTAYLSDWSFDQLQQGKMPNWIVRRESFWWEGLSVFRDATNKLRELLISNARDRCSDGSVAKALDSAQNSRGMTVAPSDRNTSAMQLEDLALYPDPITAHFPIGYLIYDESGTQLNSVKGPASVALSGEVTLCEPHSNSVPSKKSTLYLTESGYQAIKNGKASEWINCENNFPYGGPFLASNDVWNQVDTQLPRLEGFNEDPWNEVDPYSRDKVVSDIVLAHHPLTYSIFRKLGEGYSLVDGNRKWTEPWIVDGCSESLEMPSGMSNGLEVSIFHSFAMMPAREREWFDRSLPGVYQAVVDVFRRDMESHATSLDTTNQEAPHVAKNDLYLEFYRSPFVLLQKHGGEDGTYTKRFNNILSQSDSKSEPRRVVNKPSYYGVKVYKRDACIKDIPLFGAVDFEIFVELMLRNYTKRSAGLSLESSDEWLKGFFDTIYKQVFGKIEEHLSDTKTIYWRADGYFHLIPLDLIVINCGERDGIADIPMIEVSDSPAIGQVSSFANNLRNYGALLVANPEYSKSDVLHVDQGIYDDKTQKVVSRAFSNRSLSFGDLPGADEEVNRLSSKLDSAGIKSVTVLRKKDASEAAILAKLHQSGMAHLATHGFYLDMTLGIEEHGKQLLNELKDSSNPYFRSGLALEGANATLAEWSNGNVRGSSNDGILLASEVKNLNLKNLSLLVLSACSTAEGKPVDGKSVASLREAFLQAGVETLVSTLWDIPDDFAAKLMADFYQRLLSGETPSFALWHAKKENFLELRKTTGFAESMVKVAPFVAVTQAAKPDSSKPWFRF